MIFTYPRTPHVRRHSPQGYLNYTSYKVWLRDEFAFRCVYCLRRERWDASGHEAFGVDHLIPRRVYSAGTCDYENMVYACLRCNSRKAGVIDVPDPCRIAFGNLIRVGRDGRAAPLNDIGAGMIDTLDLNEPVLARFRSELGHLVRRLRLDHTATGENRLAFWLGLPDDLPDLERLRPPGGNNRPAGINESYFAKRIRRELPPIILH